MPRTATVSEAQIIEDYPGLVAAKNTMAEIAESFGLKTANMAQRVTAIRARLAEQVIADGAAADPPVVVTAEKAAELALQGFPKPPRATGPRGPRSVDRSAYNDLTATLLASVNSDDTDTEGGE